MCGLRGWKRDCDSGKAERKPPSLSRTSENRASARDRRGGAGRQAADVRLCDDSGQPKVWKQQHCRVLCLPHRKNGIFKVGAHSESFCRAGRFSSGCIGAVYQPRVLRTRGRHASGVDASGGRCFAFDVPGDGGESARNLFCGFSARSGGGRRERTRRSSRLNDHSGFNETSGPRTESFSYIRVDPAG